MKQHLTLAAIACASIGLGACRQAPTAPSGPAAPKSGTPAAPASPAPSNPSTPPGAPVSDSTNQNFTFNNRSASAVTNIYVSPVSQDTWGPDILGREILNAGETASVTFPRAETQCNWDIRVTVQGGASHELRNLNLCETTEVNYTEQ